MDAALLQMAAAAAMLTMLPAAADQMEITALHGMDSETLIPLPFPHGKQHGIWNQQTFIKMFLQAAAEADILFCKQ